MELIIDRKVKLSLVQASNSLLFDQEKITLTRDGEGMQNRGCKLTFKSRFRNFVGAHIRKLM